MVGKGSIVFVIGFITIFSYYQLKLTKMVAQAADTFNDNFMATMIHESAITAMNFGVNKVWELEISTDSFGIVAANCTASVVIYPIGSDTIAVKSKAWGYVYDEDYYVQFSAPMKKIDSLFAYFSYFTPASKFFWFTNNEAGVNWITGDTVFGPIHCNNILKTNGSPVFYGKVTARTGISPNPAAPGSQAKFYGGWEVGVESAVPTDMSYLVDLAVTSNAGAPANTVCMYDQETTFNFLANGNVIRTVGANPPDTVALTDIAPDDVIYCSETVHVEGVINGQVTIYTPDNIYIDNDIVYADNPLTNPESDDLLGLVSSSNVIISENSFNNDNVNIQACIFAATGSFAAENYAGRPVSGTINFVGSITQNTRGAVGTWSHSVNHGFQKKYYFDGRLRYMSPPSYPAVRALKLVTWWE